MGLSLIELGTLVGSFPSIAMLFASILLTAFKVSNVVEGIFQNFAAGLILAAGI
jgi:hypothetical protein